MNEKRIYKPLPKYSRDQIKIALETDDIETLILVAFSTATFTQDWKYAQDLCLRLSNHSHVIIRGNALLALGYVARIHHKLEKHVVKPVLLNARKDTDQHVRSCAEDAIAEVNYWMYWHLGETDQTETQQISFTTNWIPYDGGSSLGTKGSENGTIIKMKNTLMEPVSHWRKMATLHMQLPVVYQVGWFTHASFRNSMRPKTILEK